MHEQFAATLDGFKGAAKEVVRWIDTNGTDQQRAMFDQVADNPALFEELAFTSGAPTDLLDRLTKAWDKIEVLERLPAFECWAKGTGQIDEPR